MIDPTKDYGVLSDTTLVKIIHTEEYRGYDISAMLSRFGGIDVMVFDAPEHDLASMKWQGFNVISARLWIDKRLMQAN